MDLICVRLAAHSNGATRRNRRACKRFIQFRTKPTCCAGTWFGAVLADVVCSDFKNKQRRKLFRKAEYPAVALSMRQLVLLALAGRTIWRKEIVILIDNFLIVVGVAEIYNYGMSFELQSAFAKFHWFQHRPVLKLNHAIHCTRPVALV